jgi:hypothetical protein
LLAITYKSRKEYRKTIRKKKRNIGNKKEQKQRNPTQKEKKKDSNNKRTNKKEDYDIQEKT